MNLNTTLLEQLGMTSKEVKLYLKLLELEISGANTLAKRTEEKRTTTYSLLNSMIKKGFVTYFKKNNTKYYSATSPRSLIENHLEQAQGLKAILPQLLAIDNKHGQKPKITFYEGVSGIKQICETLLVPNSVRESFMGIDGSRIHPEIKKYFEEDIVNRRIEMKQLYRGIVAGYLPMASKHPKTEKGQYRELKYIDPCKLPLKIHIDIYPENKVAIYSYHVDEMMGIIIEHESFYQSMRTVFKLAWAGVDTLNIDRS